jgi:hypothetical protein
MDNLIDLQSLPQANKRQLENVEIGPNDLSIDLLRAVYRNNQLPLTTRMRAAMAALKHEVPALIATAVVNEGDFATILDRRIVRLQEIESAKLIEAQPKPEAVEVAPTPSINYRSLRRRI